MAKKSSENNSTNSSITMEQLLAAKPQTYASLTRGQLVEGEILTKTNKEIILDLGTKSEGNLSSKDMPLDQFQNLKVGEKIKAYVAQVENENGQTVLTYQPTLPKGLTRQGQNLQKFIQAQNQKSQLLGKIVEVNKGGIIVEVAGTRGFLPSSQLGFDFLSKVSSEVSDLKGIDVQFTISEIDQKNNNLIFSQKLKIPAEALEKLESFKGGQQVSGKIVALMPFGIALDVSGMRGLVYLSDISWERLEDLASKYTLGQTLEVQVLGYDLNLGRLNLSIKHLAEDPFKKLSEKYNPDEVIKGQIVSVSDIGLIVKLEDLSGEGGSVDGFLPASKMEGQEGLEVGKLMSFLIDSVDLGRRRINLAPFVTTTKGLIYK